VTNQIFLGILTAAVVIAAAAGAMIAYVRTRGSRLVTGPAIEEPAPSEPAPADAPEHATAAERKAAFRTMAQWYSGKQCAICKRDIPPLRHFGPEPGLLSPASPGAGTIAWVDVPPHQLHAWTSTHLPVCSSCHLMMWFQHAHPDLVVDRHRTQESDPGSIVH